MSADPYIGALLCFPFQRSIANFAVCAGQTMAVSQYQALFAVIGTIYGGNGSTEFNLPNLAGRVPVGRAASGVYSVTGQGVGSATALLTPAQLPTHSHAVTVAPNGTTAAFNASASTGTTNIPSNTATISEASVKVGLGPKQVNFYAPAGTAAGKIPAVLFGGTILQNTGTNTAFSIVQPTMALNYQIALQGIFPTQA